ncbi:MAG TPA: hypothetical protein VK213_11230 [Bacteroidales bacterium]|nr:hypothetical protein [Bacteroidales bacterium]
MDARPLRIFTSNDSPRLRYIAGILLGEILGLQWEITSDKRKIRKCPVINYSSENIEGALSIIPEGLLMETGIHSKDVKVSTWKGLPVFFPKEQGDIPFDIFSASFFLVSRYEEYLDHEPDGHGRFRHTSSIASRNGFLGIPVVDLWTRELARCLLKKFRSLTFRRHEFQSVIVIDSDHESSNSSGNILSSITGRLSGKHRKSSYPENDIPDSFSYIFKKVDKKSLSLKFFFAVGDRSKHDKNPSWKNTDYRSLIFKIAARSCTGICTSYFVLEKKLAADEVMRMENIVGGKVSASRFHSQRFFFPHSFRILQQAGIKEDYSMGYPDEPGFRAGIARSFYFYDLPEEKQTTLRIYPFQFMDEILLKPGSNIEEALKAMEEIIDQARNVGGLFISAWHIHGFINNGLGDGVKNIFERMLQYQEDDSIS